MNPRISLLAVVTLALSACGGGSMSDLETYVQQVKEREAAPIEPLPEIKQIDTFVFEPRDRRDPFTLDAQTAEAAVGVAPGGVTLDITRRKEELEQYPLDSIKMVGTLEQDDAVWALVTAPGGVLHRVQVGNYLGTNNGQITRITDTEIELIEIISDGTSQWRERAAAIALSQ
jgi:type IV pilus assembly protein PilP